MSRLLTLVAFASLTSACSTPVENTTPDAFVVADAGSDAATVPTDAGSGTGTTTIGPTERPARLVAPTSPGTGLAPLVVLLHGYGATGAVQDNYLGVSREAGTRGVWTLLPDGTVDSSGMRYWNAYGCCDFAASGVDDVAYLRALVHEAIASRPIDPSRVYFFGHSNGGFMSYRIACELADEVSAIAVLAGSDRPNDTDCVPSQPVSVLHMHGTADTTIPYIGGNVGLGPFPGAETVVARWAARAGCDATPAMGTPIDMESSLAGAETTPSTYGGCDSGLDARLLTIAGASHIPAFTSGVIGTEVLDWLLTHHR